VGLQELKREGLTQLVCHFLAQSKTGFDQVQNRWIEACRELSETCICRVRDDESTTSGTLRLDEGPIELRSSFISGAACFGAVF
jgi:hypothetical protein